MPEPPVKLTRHSDHDPALICRPAFGRGLCELLEPDGEDESGEVREGSEGMRGMMADCPFCARIAAHAYDAGDQYAVTFEPLNPVTPGHRLFVPRAHLADALVRPVITGRVMEYAARWAFGHDLWPCNLITSVGAEATQRVFHLHIHLVPRSGSDGLALPWTGQQSGGSGA